MVNMENWQQIHPFWKLLPIKHLRGSECDVLEWQGNQDSVYLISLYSNS